MTQKRIAIKPRENNAVPAKRSLGGESLLTLQMMMCAPDVALELTIGNKRVEGTLQEVAKAGSLSLYYELGPRDGAEAMLAALSVGVSNATMDCLSDAARTKNFPEIRDMNLRNGFRGALVATELLDALQRRRRQAPKGVTVGNVNVEAGAQAIVGNVQTDGQRSQASPEPEAEDTED
jgi:hypothetical protein